MIDVHTHINPAGYPLAFDLARTHGISRIVNLSGGNQTRPKAMTAHVKAIADHPGQLAVFYNVPWRHYRAPNFVDVVCRGFEEAVSNGYAGLKISKVLGLGVPGPDGGFMPVDTPALDPLWAKAGELGVPVSIHTGDPKAFFFPVTADNERFEELSEAPDWSFADPKYPRREVLLAQRDRMLEKHRGTTFILVHFGNNPEDIDYVSALLDRHPNAMVDISARVGEIGRHDPAKVRALFERHKTRILFGTDMGVTGKRQGDEVQHALFLGSLTKGGPPELKAVTPFLEAHWAFLEKAPTSGKIAHPIPIQGSWQVTPVGLPADVLKRVYHDNAMRLIFEPMFKRQGRPDPLVPVPPKPVR